MGPTISGRTALYRTQDAAARLYRRLGHQPLDLITESTKFRCFPKLTFEVGQYGGEVVALLPLSKKALGTNPA